MMSDDKDQKPKLSPGEWGMRYRGIKGVEHRESMEFYEKHEKFHQLIENLPAAADEVFEEIGAKHEVSLEPFCKRLVAQTEAARFDQDAMDVLTTDWVAFIASKDGQPYYAIIQEQVINLMTTSNLKATSDQIEKLVAFILVEAGDRLCARTLANYLRDNGIEENKILKLCPPASGPTLQKLREQSYIIDPEQKDSVRPTAEIVTLNPTRDIT